MNVKKKVQILIIICVLMVTLLCWIQYSLVRNTYDLNTKSYFAEVKRKLNTIGQPAVDSANRIATRAFAQHASWYSNHHNRKTFLDSLSRVVAQGNRYIQKPLDSALGDPPVKLTMQYASIVLAVDGVQDTLLKNTDQPFVILGEPVSDEQLIIGEGFQTNSFTGNDPVTAEQKPIYTLTVHYIKKADIMGWQRQIMQRMAGTFLLASTLILGMVMLFYFIFRTLLHQKKIADIQTDLTNNITHELRTPLSSLAIIIKTFRKTLGNDPNGIHNDLIASLERQQRKLSNIVDRVLESAWVTDVQLLLNQYEMNLLVRQIVLDFPMNTHVLTLNISQDEVWINTDEHVLTGIIHNLLDNAVKYSNAGTGISVTTHTEKKRYVITVNDHGRGIPKSEQAAIFNKFHRVMEKDLHSVKGMGLGLYLCQINIERLNGSLTVTSEPLKGSTFTIVLPNE